MLNLTRWTDDWGDADVGAIICLSDVAYDCCGLSLPGHVWGHCWMHIRSSGLVLVIS